MEMVRFTENQKEMIDIARLIIKERKDIYYDSMMKLIINGLRGRFPSANDEEIEHQFLLTVYHYWAYGVSFDEYYYYRFAEKTHEEKLQYMTYRFRMLYGQHLNERDMAHLLMNKYETYSFFKKEYGRDVILCKSESDYSSFCDFCSKHPEFVVKPTDMGGGRGVHKSSVVGMSQSEMRKYYNSLLREGIENRNRYLKGREQSVVLEELIEQDEEIGVYNTQSIQGVRVNTINLDGKVVIYEPWLKVGRGGNFLTSAVFGTMVAGIDECTGIVNSAGFTESGEIWDRHPDNNIEIKGFRIPKWDKLIELAKECALKMPFFRYIAWDFALSKNGWCIMEGNYCGDFMWQLFRERGMKKEFEELIGWKLEKQFWWQV